MKQKSEIWLLKRPQMMTGISKVYKASILASSLAIFVSCTSIEEAVEVEPQDTVVSFFAVPLDKNTTVEAYLNKVDPYLNDPALSSIRKRLESSPSYLYFKYEDVEIKEVTKDIDTANVVVSYSLNIFNTTGSNETLRTVELSLTNNGSTWEITE